MANISTYLANILSAVYGRDVRQSIHDAISAINGDATSAVNTVSTLSTSVDALSDEVDTFTASLETEATAREAVDQKAQVALDTIEKLGTYDLINNMSRTDYAERHGLAWTWNGGSVACSGTATQTTWNDLFMSTSRLPDGIVAGGTYYVKYSGTNIRLRIWWYNSSGTLTSLLNTVTDATFTVPSTAVGIIIRLHVPSGTTVGETVSPAIYGIMSTEMLQDVLTEYNCTKLKGLTRAGASVNGVTYEYDADTGVYTVSGTATGYAGNNLFLNRTALPTGVSPDTSLYVDFSATDANIRANVISYFDGGAYSSQYFSESSFVHISSSAVGLCIRLVVTVGNTVNGTATIDIYKGVPSKKVAAASALPTNYGLVFSADYETCDEILHNSIYFVSGTSGEYILTDWPLSTPGWLQTTLIGGDASLGVYQIAIPWDTRANHLWRVRMRGTWTDWKAVGLGNYGPVTLGEYATCDDVLSDGIYFVSYASGEAYIDDFPISGAGWLEVTTAGSRTIVLQRAYPYSADTQSQVWRTCKSGTWTAWQTVGSGDTYEVTQNINRDEINNTYNLTVSPTITTDTNGWLVAVDNETTSETDATDMTSAIVAMLTETGYCHLGPGTFYVSGGIDMPAGSTLEGCGKSTIVRLLSSVTSGYIVQPTTRCAIKDIYFSGGTSVPADIYTENLTDFGSRHGVYLVGNADGETSHATVSTYCNTLSNCYFQSFDGSAVYMANTGGSTKGYLTMSDTNIYACLVGINIDWYSEYNKFSNVIITTCNTACFNNGGNNVFVGCTFQGVVGFVIDNSASDKRNIAHGTCTGCTFNHINNYNQSSVLGMGDGIVVKNAVPGFIFTGCQLWYGEIVIENSRGISFTNCLIGGRTPTITVTGSYPAFFGNCTFHQSPAISVTSGTKFTACYLDTDGSEVTA